MKVRDMIDMLSDFEPNAELMVVTQPTYPVNVLPLGVWTDDGGEDEDEDHDEDGERELDPRVYIVTGSSPHDNPYGPHRAFDEVGW